MTSGRRPSSSVEKPTHQMSLQAPLYGRSQQLSNSTDFSFEQLEMNLAQSERLRRASVR